MKYTKQKLNEFKEIERLLGEHLNGDETSFAGFSDVSNRMGRFFKNEFKIYSNDSASLLHINTLATITTNKPPHFERLKLNGVNDPLRYLQKHPLLRNYNESEMLSPLVKDKDINNSIGFSNAQRIEFITRKTNKWYRDNLISTSGYYHILNSLIQGIIQLINDSRPNSLTLASIWRKGSNPKLKLIPDNIKDNHQTNCAFNTNLNQVAKYLNPDIAFLDIYEDNQSNNHLLFNDGNIGLEDYSQFINKQISDFKLDYCDVLSSISAKHVILKYDFLDNKSLKIEECIERHARKGSVDSVKLTDNQEFIYFTPKRVN